jgi:hypothetical protein
MYASMRDELVKIGTGTSILGQAINKQQDPLSTDPSQVQNAKSTGGKPTTNVDPKYPESEPGEKPLESTPDASTQP